MAYQTESSVTESWGSVEFRATIEDHSLVKSLQAILKEIDDQYERERQSLITALPDTCVKDRALFMLESRYYQRRENYLRELAALEGL
ncbi:hypothetical protein DC522_06105 [Microvirga sp. KLBC 81]|uniref:hypothetical protein n=1 Tax=Microvirga sp. KLBC 81 TaxID=1862707 RepID=UPI000D513B7F|nr:hypothetical protein [Microvirga sp. KLBC 81]PVE25466.1 hypothetical protein DC522_06105 [Microvirga sp. KLBC 81]